MGSIHAFNPVKLFIGVLAADGSLIPEIERRLAAQYGEIDHRSSVIPFDFTEYYRNEMGSSIKRIFFSFERLIEGDDLPDIKRNTNALEAEFAAGGGTVPRPINLDPGYLENAKVVLASTKNFYHRIYLAHGIFAEVTMHFRDNTFQFFPWTYPDYQSKDYQEFFLSLRQIYRGQLKNRCILDRKAPTDQNS